MSAVKSDKITMSEEKKIKESKESISDSDDISSNSDDSSSDSDDRSSSNTDCSSSDVSDSSSNSDCSCSESDCSCIEYTERDIDKEAYDKKWREIFANVTQYSKDMKKMLDKLNKKLAKRKAKLRKLMQKTPEEIEAEEKRKAEYEPLYKKLLKKLSSKHQNLAKAWLIKAITKFGYKYKYRIDQYKSGKKKISIVCDKGHQYKQTPQLHITKNSQGGCKICSRKETYTRETLIVECKKAHGPDRYGYHLIPEDFKGIFSKITLVCNVCNDIFPITANNHLNNRHGCGECGGTRLLTKEEMIERSDKEHNCEYEYLGEYKNNQTAMLMRHKKCMLYFEQRPSNHMSGEGCPYCYGKKARSLDAVKEYMTTCWNGYYNYDKVTSYKNNNTKFSVDCPECGKEFETNLKLHVDQKRGCPKCSQGNFSGMSIKWLEYRAKIDNVEIQHAGNEGEFKIPGTKYKADGYAKKTNTIYEFHGDHWHGNPRTKLRDKINASNGKTYGELYEMTLQKEKEIRALGYNYISIWEYDWRVHCNQELIKGGTDLYVCELCNQLPYKTKEGYDNHMKSKHIVNSQEDKTNEKVDERNEEKKVMKKDDSHMKTKHIMQIINSKEKEKNEEKTKEKIEEKKVEKTEETDDNRLSSASDSDKSSSSSDDTSNNTSTSDSDSDDSSSDSSDDDNGEKQKVKKRKSRTKKSPEEKHKCPKCNNKYSAIGRLNKHIKDKHEGTPLVEKIIKCEICKIKYTSMVGLRYHMNHEHPKEK